MSQPRLSIGLPVYNGENYLEAALDAVLAQSFDDFELIISDNASTDRTAAICERYAARDARIRYHRQSQNLGAAPNFNWVFAQARAPYFKWLAHDDLVQPGFLAACMHVLESDPSVVVASTRTAEIDEQGRVIGTLHHNMRTDSPHPHVRFFDLINHPYCYQIFGVIRSDVLAKTPLIQSFAGSDGCLLAELSLYGPIVERPEVLFLMRNHPGRSTRAHTDHLRRAVWFDTRKNGKLSFPAWQAVGYYLRALWAAPLTARERMRVLERLGHWSLRLRWRVLAGELKQNAAAAWPLRSSFQI